MDRFLTRDNAQVCADTLAKYMSERFGFDVHDPRVPLDPRRVVYRVMSQVGERNGRRPGVTVRELNNLALNAVRDFYVTEFGLDGNDAQGRRPRDSQQASPVARDQALYGDSRPLNDAQIKPVISRDRDDGRRFETEQEERRRGIDGPAPPPLPAALTPLDVTSEDADSFLSKLARMETDRSAAVPAPAPPAPQIEQQRSAAMLPPVCDDDPAKMYRDVLDRKAAAAADEAAAAAADAPYSNAAADVLIQRPPGAAGRAEARYLALNGFDRNWTANRERFRFVIDTSAESGSERDKRMTAVRVSRVILPMEIVQERTLSDVPKPSFVHEFSFAYPFVTLTIDELAGGTYRNGDVFCQLVYESHYKAPNGRGYVILKPMQDERRDYAAPEMLPTRFTVALQRPNGVLFNDSRDEYRLRNVFDDDANARWLRVTTTKYFDKNEFYKGDVVFFRNLSCAAYRQAARYQVLRTFLNDVAGHPLSSFSTHPGRLAILAPTVPNSVPPVVDGDWVASLTEWVQLARAFGQPNLGVLRDASGNQACSIADIQYAGGAAPMNRYLLLTTAPATPPPALAPPAPNATAYARGYIDFDIDLEATVVWKGIDAFMTRREGHEILELGTGTQSVAGGFGGYYQDFRIEAPGGFDKDTGRYQLDAMLNEAFRTWRAVATSQAAAVCDGDLLNMSLQVSMGLQLSVTS